MRERSFITGYGIKLVLYLTRGTHNSFSSSVVKKVGLVPMVYGRPILSVDRSSIVKSIINIID